MKYFKRTPEYDKLVKQYYPDADPDEAPDSIEVHEVVIITKTGKESGGVFTYTYVDGKEVGITLRFKNEIISDHGISLRNKC